MKQKTNPNAQNLNEVPKTTRELIAEKYRLAEERSKVIQQELKRVAQFKQEITQRYNIK